MMFNLWYVSANMTYVIMLMQQIHSTLFVLSLYTLLTFQKL